MSWTGHFHPAPPARPTSRLSLLLVPDLRQGGAWPVLSPPPGSYLSAPGSPEILCQVARCAQPGSSKGYRRQNPGGERVEQALSLVPWGTLDRSMPPLGLSISIPQLRCLDHSGLGLSAGGRGGAEGTQRGLRSSHPAPTRSAFSCPMYWACRECFIWCFEDTFCCFKNI